MLDWLFEYKDMIAVMSVLVAMAATVVASVL
jgi:hypothetical protein